MKSYIGLFLLFTTSLELCFTVASAQVPKVHSIVPNSLFGDHAILQREKQVPVWGVALAGDQITISFGGKNYSGTADPEGKWKILLDAMPASAEPHDLTISSSSGDSIVLKDILVGEVWLASGQSNMLFAVGWGILNTDQEVAGAHFPDIREFHLSQDGALTPKNTVSANWQICSPDTVRGFSSVGFFFARDLYKKLGIPVGIITTAFGASPAEAWTSREALNTVPEFKSIADQEITEMEAAPASQAAWPAAMAAWESANGVDDKQNEGDSKGWAAPDFDDSGWKTVTTGFNLSSGMNTDHGGIYWVRKTIDLPEGSAGKSFGIDLGYIVEQCDKVYFNGVQVADDGKNPPDFYSSPRGAHIPGNLVKAGKNVIAIRLVADTSNGGFYITGDRMQLPVENPKAVDNSWKIAWEREYPKISPEALAMRPKVNTRIFRDTPTCIFNAMINPLIPYAIRGAIWYQGESNTQSVERANQYKTLLPLMISDWRTRWHEGDFPFYIVQLANNDSVDRSHKENPWSILREAQMETLTKSPNTGLAVAIDIGSDITIHPKDKQDVGKRLAIWALADTYGGRGFVYRSPIYKSFSVDSGKIRVAFDTGGAPLMVGKKDGLDPTQEIPGGKLDWFEIAGADGKYEWADASIDGDSVVVSSPNVSDPKSVRYAWATNPQGCNLYNKAGFPASPFRTNPEP